MLGKTAKKLRILGFDTEYLVNIDDNEIINRCLDRKRVILTKDRQLYKRLIKLYIPCFLIISENELENLIMIMKESDINYVFPVPNENTRCSLCNEILDKIPKSSLVDIVPKKVFENVNKFFTCPNCKKIYWGGKHIREINYLIDEINIKIKQV
jgi:uncharacterized protein with PIN domain